MEKKQICYHINNSKFNDKGLQKTKKNGKGNFFNETISFLAYNVKLLKAIG